ncbi:MAG: AMP-binding protein [Prevotella sp.]|nr:AMP-binding protein [Prevotella sp.]MCM1074972.1 AMP-binding protein [Ruminococcus sp.]
MYRYPDNFIKLYEKSFRQNAELPAISLYGRPGAKSYLHLAANVARAHILFSELGLKRGDKIAIYAKDTDVWIEAFMAVITYGATVVPILPDFIAEDATNIINHSEAKLLMTDDQHWKALEFKKMKHVEVVLSLSRPELLEAKDRKKVEKLLDELGDKFANVYPQGFTAEDIHYPQVNNNDVIVLNYTSGTTGFSKGVMLTGWNLAGNVVFGLSKRLHYPRSRVLTFLPMAHAYGCTFDLLLPLAAGSHVTVLGKTPTPAILLKALAEVKPNILLSVPLVFEKIYRRKIEPLLSTQKMQQMLSIPGIRGIVKRKLRSKLMESLGGNLDQVIIGGAAMGADTEEFLRMIKFPYTVGYGMTECGPLISYTHAREYIPGSAGRTLPRIMESRIDSPDPMSIPGEILVRGQNVMKGYFKNEKATDEAIDAEGWLHTGDMGTRTPDGTLFLRGRSKTMILSASGQNIYPEELEARINAMPFVGESLVVDRDGKLIALVFLDKDTMKERRVTEDKIPALLEKLKARVNKSLAAYERIADFEAVEKEFEKTPKKSIKRFLYK